MSDHHPSLSTPRRFLGGFAGVVALSIAASAFAAQPAWRERSVGRVAAVAGRSGGARLVAARAARAAHTRCIGVDHVAGAVVFGDRAVELSMTDGSRWRMSFAQSCPALSFYQGFYYRRAIAGRLCAARDAVIARSGGECPIDTIVKVASARR